MLRANRRFKLHRDFRGKITCGNRNKAEGENPKALDHFNLIDFPELAEIYGKKPTEIFIILASDNIEEFYQDGYSRWGKKGETAFLIRKCDGETSYDPITESYEPCHLCHSDECKLEADKRCRPFGFLRAFVTTIPDPEKGIPPIVVNMAPYQFEWHSENSGDNVYSELHKTWTMTGGRLFGVPMKITVKMVEELKQDGTGKTYKKKYPLIYLEQVGSIDRVIAIAKAKVLPTLPENTALYKQLSAGPETSGLKALAQGNGNGKQPEQTPANPEAQKRETVLNNLKDLLAKISQNAADPQDFRAQINMKVFNANKTKEITKLPLDILESGREILSRFKTWGDQQTEKVTEQAAFEKLDDLIFVVRTQQEEAAEIDEQLDNPQPENQPELF